MLPQFSYVRPASIETAIAELSTEGAFVHAGGTDLLGCMREGILPLKKMVSLSGIDHLAGIRKTDDGGLRIGAMTTISDVAKNPLVAERYPGLAQGASEVASPQLRNQGTLGGNLCQKPRCWYYRGEFHCLRKGGDLCYAAAGENQFHAIFGSDDRCFIVHPSDTAPVLCALDAAVSVAGPRGRRTIPVSRLHVPPAIDPRRETVLENDEVVTEIRLPPPVPGLISRYRKVRARRSWDFSIAGVALAVRFDGNRVADSRVYLSGAAPVPWRSVPVEEAINGMRLDPATVTAAADAVVHGASPLVGNAYKLPLFRGVIREELDKLNTRQG